MEEAISDYDRASGPFDPSEADASGAEARELDPPSTRRPLGSLLTGAGLITEEQLAEALGEGASTGARLGDVVVDRGWATEDDVAKLLAEQWELGYVDRASIFFDAEALARLSRDQARTLEALPTRVQDGHVVVAVAEPTEQRLNALRAVIGDDTVVVVVPKTALDAGLRSDLLSGNGREDDVPLTAAAPAQERQARHLDEVEAISPPPLAAEPFPGADAELEPAGTHTDCAEEPDLMAVLAALEAAAGEATALQLRVSELARGLARIAADVASAAARLETSAVDVDNQARIQQLEEQLAQRTAMAESLKTQLVGLTRTLDDYS